ncbi:hypothetical protein R0F62_02870 [Wolbachia endosymbiont of Drosophila aff. chauvacae BK-2020]|uniref:hypothetical protein n=1 Tax=unclassified Wolbachia TaxID=2640676 RepID=UPI0023A9A94B|nr:MULTISPECIES: hypothetical protein [unclassified Wolbachia]MDE5059453.1 hypothetical protein [Wolbachia endosymbiont of Drosophila burlai]MDE5063747.1 hypothetical protein [Wolbachia endosymbiont of Drosophila chauvacae]MDU8908615.1 hypothetical protein [Wolbachia endosymbiont of Drosophila bocqueti]WOE63243.1 hypothetical protein R0F62_02870 [Wolbachia endosymbiont of Drosophila aff. chauvacae BK-2020]
MSVYRYFRRYVEYGVVPAKKAEDNTLVPENSFYKSVRYVDNVLGPVKDVICGVESKDNYNKYYQDNDKRGSQGRESAFIVCTWCYFSSQHNIATFMFDTITKVT